MLRRCLTYPLYRLLAFRWVDGWLYYHSAHTKNAMTEGRVMVLLCRLVSAADKTDSAEGTSEIGRFARMSVGRCTPDDAA